MSHSVHVLCTPSAQNSPFSARILLCVRRPTVVLASCSSFDYWPPAPHIALQGSGFVSHRVQKLWSCHRSIGQVTLEVMSTVFQFFHQEKKERRQIFSSNTNKAVMSMSNNFGQKWKIECLGEQESRDHYDYFFHIPMPFISKLMLWREGGSEIITIYFLEHSYLINPLLEGPAKIIIKQCNTGKGKYYFYMIC